MKLTIIIITQMQGITAFLIEKGTPGLVVGKKEDKLGISIPSYKRILYYTNTNY